MSERIGKFLLCLVLVPFLIFILAFCAAVCLVLPVIVLIYPQIMTVGKQN